MVHHPSHKVLHMQLSIEQEYMAKIEYYEVSLNQSADALSRIQQSDDEIESYMLFKQFHTIMMKFFHQTSDTSRLNNSKKNNSRYKR